MLLIHAIQKHDAALERPLYHQNATIGVNCWCESRFLISRGRKCALRDVICVQPGYSFEASHREISV